MSKSIFDQIVSTDNILSACNKTRRGKFKLRAPVIAFKENETINILTLQHALRNNDYIPGEYNKFYVLDPKRRLVHAPKYIDKIVQHSVNNVLLPIVSKSFIYDSYACIPLKGNQRAVLRIKDFMHFAYNKWGEEAYVVKVDIKKFFYTIDREILKNLLPKIIKCKETLILLNRIIDSSPGELGLPLGNLTSQFLANVYLNALDQYVKRRLSVKYYVRYADDIIAIVENKEEANKLLKSITDFLTTELNLEIHPTKTKIHPMSIGTDSLGFKIFYSHILLNKQGKVRIKTILNKLPKVLKRDEVTIEQAEFKLNTWLAHIKLSNYYNFLMSILKKYPYLYLDDKERIRINKDKLYTKKINTKDLNLTNMQYERKRRRYIKNTFK